MKPKPSKEAQQLIKFLSMYMPENYLYYNIGAEVYYMMDSTQEERFRHMMQGFRHARKGV